MKKKYKTYFYTVHSQIFYNSFMTTNIFNVIIFRTIMLFFFNNDIKTTNIE